MKFKWNFNINIQKKTVVVLNIIVAPLLLLLLLHNYYILAENPTKEGSFNHSLFFLLKIQCIDYKVFIFDYFKVEDEWVDEHLDEEDDYEDEEEESEEESDIEEDEFQEKDSELQ